MPTARPFAYNPGSILSGTEQYGTIAVGTGDNPYSENYGGLQWWQGPDEDLGYCIGTSVPSGDQPTPLGNIGTVQFWRTDSFDDNQFISLSNTLSNQNFSSSIEAVTWLNDNGYWSSYAGISPSPTPTNTPTPTKTLALNGTFTVTNSHPTLIIQNIFYGQVQSPTFTSGSLPILPSQTAINNTTNFSPTTSWVGDQLQVGIIGGGSGSGYLSLLFDGCIVFSYPITSSSNVGVGFTSTCNGIVKPILSNTIVEFIISESIDPFVTPTPTKTPTPTLTPTTTPTPTPTVTETPSITPTTSQSVSSITLSFNYSLGSGFINWCNKTLEQLSEATCDAVAASYQVKNFIGTEISIGTQFIGVGAYGQCWVTNTNYPSQNLWFLGDTQYIIETNNSGVVTRYESFVVCTPPTPTPSVTPTITLTPTTTPTVTETPSITPTPTTSPISSGNVQMDFYNDLSATTVINIFINVVNYSSGIFPMSPGESGIITGITQTSYGEVGLQINYNPGSHGTVAKYIYVYVDGSLDRTASTVTDITFNVGTTIPVQNNSVITVRQYNNPLSPTPTPSVTPTITPTTQI
jgi:hypothetical protein